MKVCYVTDRKALAGSGEEQTRLLLEKMESAARADVDCIQVREKDLSGRELAALVGEAIRRIPPSCRIVVNDRLDVATAVGASGVHLGEQSISVEEARRFVKEKNLRREFFVGVSVHALESAQAAAAHSADYVIFGPVFETPSKVAFGHPQGVDRFAKVCKSLSIPVIAIGGITIKNAGECLAAGAAGIAAIRLFQESADVAALVRVLRHI